MNRSVVLSRVLWVALVCLVLTGCGYRSNSLYPQEVRTVAVPMFENRSFYRGMEYDLTEALAKQIELRSPYKVVGREAADSIIQGVIVNVSERRIAITNSGGLPQDMELVMTVDFEWRDQRTGKILRERKGVTVASHYVPTRPVSETVDVARHEAVQRMANGLVSLMRADW